MLAIIWPPCAQQTLRPASPFPRFSDQTVESANDCHHIRFKLSETYGSGFKALNGINLDIKRGEIFALLGPNGAGKTTLISIICGIAQSERKAASPSMA